MVNATCNITFGNPGSASSGQQQGTGGEAQAGDHHVQQDDVPPPPPPPESLTMAPFLQALREERQANNAAIRQLAQTLVNHPPQNENGNGRSTLPEFMRTTPPIFTETTEPLDADDWIRTIEDLLALVKCIDDNEKVLYETHCLGGTTRACWDGFQIMQARQVITSAVFKDRFRAAHIPPGMMTIKKREFQALRQGSGSVKEYLQKFNLLSRYAPEDVITEAVKVERFMEGLQQSLQYQLVVCECRTFSDLVNKALMLEDKRCAMDDTRKRKLIDAMGRLIESAWDRWDTCGLRERDWNNCINLPPFAITPQTAKVNWKSSLPKPIPEVKLICAYLELLKTRGLSAEDLLAAMVARWILTLQHRLHLICEMSGRHDPCRLSTKNLQAGKVAERVNFISSASMDEGGAWEWGVSPYDRDHPDTMLFARLQFYHSSAVDVEVSYPVEIEDEDEVEP
ncbi:hypothetical protein D1007_39252 [Hordeum vulgare]|nr:hypothetical protein D1007_39252 [Hordeum vulgare]